MEKILEEYRNKIIQGDCLETLRGFPDGVIDCVITSPPYWQLRNYGWSGQWGLEKTFEEYLENLWSLMDQIYRVLKDTGTVWINLGDSYLGTGGDLNYKSQGKNSCVGSTAPDNMPQTGRHERNKNVRRLGIRNKSLLLLPHRFAIGCMERGWIVRNDVIWAKRNGMPESVRDRFSKKHEYIFFMTKSQKYYFDLEGIRDECVTKENRPDGIVQNRIYGYNSKENKLRGYKTKPYDEKAPQHHGKDIKTAEAGKNPGSVSDFWSNYKDMSFEEWMEICAEWWNAPDDFWDVNTKPSSIKHYASYNSDLIDKPILAGCPEFVCKKCGKPREKIIKSEFKGDSNKRATFYQREKGVVNGQSGIPVESNNREVVGLTDCGCEAGFEPGIVLDPFCGTGKTLERARELGRDALGIEGSEEYVKLARRIFSTVENRLF